MREPSTRTKEALAKVEAPWDAARTERTLRALPARRRKKRAVRGIGVGLLGALVLGPALWLGVARHGATHDGVGAPTLAGRTDVTSQPREVRESSADARQLRLADGSSVALLETRTDVAVEHVDEHLVALHLRAGRARFEVSARPERVFRVRTAEVTVEVLGTIFEVEQRAGRTRVSVTRGRVAVGFADRRDVLVAGDDREFPAHASDAAHTRDAAHLGAGAAAADPREATESGPPPGARAELRVVPHGGSAAAARARRGARTTVSNDEAEGGHETSWRDHAEGGDFKSAFPLLPNPDTMATMSVSDLMLAADAARLSGHPRAALPFLTRVVENHPDDARAPLAAFTLGGVLMHQLGLPREAEAAYARARATTQSGALQQDALARQVEAASRAGDETLARKLARAYLDQYPEGRRVNAVRRFGRL